MKNLRLFLLVCFLVQVSCKKDAVPDPKDDNSIGQMDDEPNVDPTDDGPVQVEPVDCVKFDLGLLDSYDSGGFDDGEVESFKTLENEFLVFTEGLGGNVTDLAFEIFYQTTFDVEYQVWQNNADGTSIQIARDSIFGEAFEAPVLSSVHGFKQEDFKKRSICIADAKGWLDIEFYRNGKQIWSLPYFIRPVSVENKVAFVASTYTLDAYYIGLGGRSYYRNNNNDPGTYTRPNNYPYSYNFRSGPTGICEHLLRVDQTYLKYFAENGVKMDFVDDRTLTRWNTMSQYETIILGTHNEYWTPETFRNIKRFIDGGGNLLVLGGNTAYRVFKQKKDYKVLIQSVTTGDEYQIVHDYLGSFYTSAGYLTFAPYSKLADHALLEGVPESFGLSSTNNCNTHSSSIGDGASGWETDKKINETFITLAKGGNPNETGADIVYKEFDSGGKVINFGSLSLVGALEDPGLNTLMQNIIDDMGMR